VAETEGLGVVDESLTTAAFDLAAYIGKAAGKGVRVGIAVILLYEVGIYGETRELALRFVKDYIGIISGEEIVEVGDDGRHTSVGEADFGGGWRTALRLFEESRQLALKLLGVGAEIRSGHKPDVVFCSRDFMLLPGEVVKVLKEKTNFIKALFGALGIFYAHSEPPTEPLNLLFQSILIDRIREIEMVGGNPLLCQDLCHNAGVGAVTTRNGDEKVRLESAAHGVYPLNPGAEGFGEAADFGFFHKRRGVVSADEKVV